MAKRTWRQTTATVSKCRRRLGGFTEVSELSGLPMDEYLVTFHYEVEGRIFRGSFKSDLAIEIGSSFDLDYDEKDPSLNDRSMRRRTKLFAWVVGILLAAFLIWLEQKMLGNSSP
jgi:hypothetical protein